MHAVQETKTLPCYQTHLYSFVLFLLCKTPYDVDFHDMFLHNHIKLSLSPTLDT